MQASQPGGVPGNVGLSFFVFCFSICFWACLFCDGGYISLTLGISSRVFGKMPITGARQLAESHLLKHTNSLPAILVTLTPCRYSIKWLWHLAYLVE